MIDCGRFNKRVEILKWVESENEIGETINKLDVFKTIWAEIHPLKGKEYVEAKMLEAETTYKVTCRYFKGLTEDMYIRYLDLELQITSICDSDMKHKYYEIMCKKNNKKQKIVEN